MYVSGSGSVISVWDVVVVYQKHGENMCNASQPHEQNTTEQKVFDFLMFKLKQEI